MKIRSDFVTNSSSSSYVISYKEPPEFDEETLAKYPFLPNMKDTVESILFAEPDYSDTTKGVLISNKDELDKYCEKEWCYVGYTLSDMLLEDEYYQGIYNAALDALDEGSSIIMKRIDNGDDFLIDMIRKMSKSNIGVSLVYEG